MPYRNLDHRAFWRLCREDAQFRLYDIYRPKFQILPGQRIATAGSCFAQNISRFLQRSTLNFHQLEPIPRGMDSEVARRFGFGLFSARYGNIYTARQLRQLFEDAIHARQHGFAIWEKSGRFFDALRPGVEPLGLGCAEEVQLHRADHLTRVVEMIETMDVFVFTLGLTETWAHTGSGVVFPMAPGTIAGAFDAKEYHFVNQRFGEVMEDMQAAIAILRAANPRLRIILTVSPVPLTATASDNHVLSATTYSKSVLRAVAEELCQSDPDTDYFPSFEIITGLPFVASHYEANLRSVSPDAIDRVMQIFFEAHGAALDLPKGASLDMQDTDDVAQTEICEEALLEAFAPK